MSDLLVTRFVRAPHRHDSGRWKQTMAAVTRAWRTYATRQALPELSDHLLADLGLSRTVALAEAARLPWDIRPVRRWRDGGLWTVIQRRMERVRTRRLIADTQPKTIFWGG